MITQAQCNIIKSATQSFSPRLLGVFGSYARSEATEKSDLDILVDFEKQISLFELIGMQQDLTEQLGIKVDLVTVHAVHPLIKEYIDKDIIYLINGKE